jgi:hypothetical protein
LSILDFISRDFFHSILEAWAALFLLANMFLSSHFALLP